MAATRVDFHSGDDFDAVLASFRSHRYDANASEAVEMIDTDEKMLLVRYSSFSHSISI